MRIPLETSSDRLLEGGIRPLDLLCNRSFRECVLETGVLVVDGLQDVGDAVGADCTAIAPDAEDATELYAPGFFVVCAGEEVDALDVGGEKGAVDGVLQVGDDLGAVCRVDVLLFGAGDGTADELEDL